MPFLFLLCVAVFIYFKYNPFQFPYFKHEFDVSGRRLPKIEDLIDEFIMENGFDVIKEHQKEIRQWHRRAEEIISHSIIKPYRRWQYQKAADDENAYIFITTRSQVRYRQVNYRAIAYKSGVMIDRYTFEYDDLERRNIKLSKINYETTLNSYDSQNQRGLLTTKLRLSIMERDNYTCQECGKFMPDEVGLQIDHIKPIKMGGKTVASNLQVLCSKCNGRKSDKYREQ